MRTATKVKTKKPASKKSAGGLLGSMSKPIVREEKLAELDKTPGEDFPVGSPHQATDGDDPKCAAPTEVPPTEGETKVQGGADASPTKEGAEASTSEATAEATAPSTTEGSPVEEGAGGQPAGAGDVERQDAGGTPGDAAVPVQSVTEEEVMHLVTFDLKEDEFASKGKEAAELQSQISKLNYDFAGVKRTHKAETELREEKIAQLLGTIRRGKEDRDVKCKKVYDFETGIVRFFHENKLVDERPMEPGERQMRAAI